MKQTIPAATIGLLSQILPDYYTHDGLNGLFLTASAPEEIPVGSKSSKVTTWLRSINAKCSDSIAVLGSLLGDFMDRESFFATCFGFGVDEESASKLREAQNKVSETLSKDGFCYSRGGHVTKGGTISTISLQENVSKRGLGLLMWRLEER